MNPALLLGPFVIGECILAEITPALEPAELGQFIADWRDVAHRHPLCHSKGIEGLIFPG
ncbi:MAG: hypothetical protein WCS65_11860 [Verrucomicrobiae bacterium]